MLSERNLAPELDLLILSFPMHFAWEVLQAPLFASMQMATHMDGIRICLQATLGDMVIALLAFWTASILTGTRQWAVRPARWATVAWFGVGIVITIVLEFYSTEISARWSYGASMPRLPLTGTGITPLLQWVVIPMIVLWYLRRIGVRAGSDAGQKGHR